jgi:drug/metabolite transporter (DMT)-like permease
VAFALAPAFAAVGAFVLLGESFSAKKLLGLVLILAGIVVLTTRD